MMHSSLMKLHHAYTSRTIWTTLCPIKKRLIWTTKQSSNTVNFLDLTLTIQEDGTITYKTCQKPDNYFLYRTPDSCQLANILTSFIYLTLQRYYHQNTFIKDYNQFAEFLFHNMMERRHTNHSLHKIFVTQSEKAQKSKMPYVTRTPQEYISKNNKTETRRLFVHVIHHPQQPRPQQTQINCKQTKRSNQQSCHQLTPSHSPFSLPVKKALPPLISQRIISHQEEFSPIKKHQQQHQQ